MQIEDGSNDKAYFTMVPNIVLNHSSAIDQALYMQMKRFAGEKSGGGLCTASHRTLMEKLKIGPKALKTSLEYLISHGWIENVGARKVMTNGGPQDVQMYRVNDIWKLNVQHYKGANESVPLSKGGDERHKGADERSKGGDESATTKNNTKTIEPSASEDGRRGRSAPTFGGEGSQEERVPKTRAKYTDARKAFKWLPNPEPSWLGNTTELECGNLLFARGEERVKRMVQFVAENKDHEDWKYSMITPCDYERKWAKVNEWKKSHGL